MTKLNQQLKDRLHGVLCRIRADLDRAELLAAALETFNKPIPEYEPEFHHAGRVFGRAERYP